MKGSRNHRALVGLGLLGLCLAPTAQAQFKIDASFRTTAAPGWVISGSNDRAPDLSGVLTAGKSITNQLGAAPPGLPPLPPGFFNVVTNDAIGNGWLRLTTRLQNQVGTALYTGGSFPSNDGVFIEFDYISWGGVPGMGADGISVFLFDANTPSPMSGNRHGAGLGYCNGAGGYLGIGIDEYGNFSSSIPQGVGVNGCATEGNNTPGTIERKPGYSPNHIVVRGPQSAGNPYVRGSAPPGGQALDDTAELPRPADIRRMRIRLLPKGAADPGYRVLIDYGAASGLLSSVFDEPLDFDFQAPDWMSIGFAGSTGDLINFHEIRDVKVNGPADIGVTKTVNAPTIARGSKATYTVVISNKDINPYDAGNQSPLLENANPPLIVDTLPTLLTGSTWTCVASNGSTCPAASGNGSISTAAYTLAPAGTLTFTVEGTVSEQAQCGATVSNTATATFGENSDFVDLDTTDNIATATFTVECPAPAALSISKDNQKTSVVPGEQMTYQVVVANAGPGAADNAVLRDPPQAGMTCTALTCSSAVGGAVCPDPSVLTIAALQSPAGVPIGTFPANSSLNFQVACTVD